MSTRLVALASARPEEHFDPDDFDPDDQPPRTTTERKHALVAAVLADDAQALCTLVSAEPPLEQDIAFATLRQAFLADVLRDRVGAYMVGGGLMSAVYVGLMQAQESMDLPTSCRADNATTVLCATAARHDDARMVEVLLHWDPNFRMGSETEKATIESTAEFFAHMSAPRCAAHVLAHACDMVSAPRDEFLREHAHARIVRQARNYQTKLGLDAPKAQDEDNECFVSVLQRGMLHDLVDAGGELLVVEAVPGLVFTLGFALIGRPELVAVARKLNRRTTALKLKRLAARALVEKSHAEANVLASKRTLIASKGTLSELLKPFAPLLAPGTPAWIVVEV